MVWRFFSLFVFALVCLFCGRLFVVCVLLLFGWLGYVVVVVVFVFVCFLGFFFGGGVLCVNIFYVHFLLKFALESCSVLLVYCT